MYGNISGYIGFFLGYSLLSIPKFLLFLHCALKKCLITIKERRANYVDPEVAEGMFMGETEQRNIEQELTNVHKELYIIGQKFQELHDRLEK